MGTVSCTVMERNPKESEKCAGAPWSRTAQHATADLSPGHWRVQPYSTKTGMARITCKVWLRGGAYWRPENAVQGDVGATGRDTDSDKISYNDCAASRRRIAEPMFIEAG